MPELFTNQASTTVSSGGMAAPAQGTVETWTVASSASFPAITSGTQQFHVADPASAATAAEIIAVTAVSGTTWTVTRGAESTAPVAHTAGFTVQQVISAASLNAFTQTPAYQFTPEAYGAKGDGVQALVTTTASSATINTTPLSAPSAPALSNAGSGGSLTAGTYQAEVTYVNQWGETVASASASQAITGTQPLTITFPAFSGNATGWYAYVTVAGGSTYFRQQTAGFPTPIGQNLVLTANPATSGANPPGSNTTAGRVFTSTAVDGGKNIMICGALGTPGGPYIGTISTVVSATQATVSSTGITASVTGAAMVFSTDDRAAIDSCMSAAGAHIANGGVAQVIFGEKIYGLGTGLFQTVGNGAAPTAGLGYNTQVRIPVGNNSGYTNYAEIHLLGPGQNTNCNFWMSAYAPTTGCCLVSYSMGPGTADATFGQQSVVGGPNTGNSNFAAGSGGFFNVTAVVRGIRVIQPGFSNSIGLDFQWLGGCVVRGSSEVFAPRWNTNAAAVNPSQGWISSAFWQGQTIGTGMRLPNLGNDADVLVESFTHVGVPIGISTQADHPVITRLESENYYNAILFTGGNSATHALTIAKWCFQDGTGGTGGNALHAGNAGAGSSIMVDIVMDGENLSMANDIYDPNNVLHGRVMWWDASRTAVNGIKSPIVTGAANLKIINAQAGPGPWATPPAAPATNTAQQNTAWRDATIVLSNTTAAITSISVGPASGTTTVTGQVSTTALPVAVRVPSGFWWKATYASGTLVATWFLD